MRDDYRISGSSRDVIFKRGTTISTPLKINIINDEVSECNETFTLSLRIAGVEKQKRVKIIPDSSNTSVVTIEDDDSEESCYKCIYYISCKPICIYISVTFLQRYRIH